MSVCIVLLIIKCLDILWMNEVLTSVYFHGRYINIWCGGHNSKLKVLSLNCIEDCIHCDKFNRD